MHKFNKFLFVAIVVLVSSTPSFLLGQPNQKISWTKMSKNKNATFYDVQNDFNHQWKEKLKEKTRGKSAEEEEREDGGYEIYKRWESFMAPRVYPSGDMSLPSNTYPNFVKWQNSNQAVKLTTRSTDAVTSNWTELGPVGSPSGPSPYSRTGAGRVNFVKFDPTNSNTLYVGAPDGGLWKSANGGSSWRGADAFS